MDWDQLEVNAYRYFKLLPQDVYRLTPREYRNLIKAKELQLDDDLHRAAVIAIMHRKAQHKKTIKLSELTGKKKKATAKKPEKQPKIEDKSKIFEEIESKFGKPKR